MVTLQQRAKTENQRITSQPVSGTVQQRAIAVQSNEERMRAQLGAPTGSDMSVQYWDTEKTIPKVTSFSEKVTRRVRGNMTKSIRMNTRTVYHNPDGSIRAIETQAPLVHKTNIMPIRSSYSTYSGNVRKVQNYVVGDYNKRNRFHTSEVWVDDKQVQRLKQRGKSGDYGRYSSGSTGPNRQTNNRQDQRTPQTGRTNYSTGYRPIGVRTQGQFQAGERYAHQGSSQTYATKTARHAYQGVPKRGVSRVLVPDSVALRTGVYNRDNLRVPYPYGNRPDAPKLRKLSKKAIKFKSTLNPKKGAGKVDYRKSIEYDVNKKYLKSGTKKFWERYKELTKGIKFARAEDHQQFSDYNAQQAELYHNTKIAKSKDKGNYLTAWQFEQAWKEAKKNNANARRTRLSDGTRVIHPNGIVRNLGGNPVDPREKDISQMERGEAFKEYFKTKVRSVVKAIRYLDSAETGKKPRGWEESGQKYRETLANDPETRDGLFSVGVTAALPIAGTVPLAGRLMFGYFAYGLGKQGYNIYDEFKKTGKISEGTQGTTAAVVTDIVATGYGARKLGIGYSSKERFNDIKDPKTWNLVKSLEKSLPRKDYLNLVENLKGIQSRTVAGVLAGQRPASILKKINWNKLSEKDIRAVQATLEVHNKYGKKASLGGSLARLSEEGTNAYIKALEKQGVKVPKVLYEAKDIDTTVKQGFWVGREKFKLDLSSAKAAKAQTKLIGERKYWKFLATKDWQKLKIIEDGSGLNKWQKTIMDVMARHPDSGAYAKGSYTLNKYIEAAYRKGYINKEEMKGALKDLSDKKAGWVEVKPGKFKYGKETSDLDFGIGTFRGKLNQRKLAEEVAKELQKQGYRGTKAYETHIKELKKQGKTQFQSAIFKDGKWVEGRSKVSKGQLKGQGAEFQLARVQIPEHATPAFDLSYTRGIGNILKKSVSMLGRTSNLYDAKGKKIGKVYDIEQYAREQVNRLYDKKGWEKGYDKILKLQKLKIMNEHISFLSAKRTGHKTFGQDLVAKMREKGVDATLKEGDGKTDIYIGEKKFADLLGYDEFVKHFPISRRPIKLEDGTYADNPSLSMYKQAFAYTMRGRRPVNDKDLARLELKKGQRVKELENTKGVARTQLKEAVSAWEKATGREYNPETDWGKLRTFINKARLTVFPANLRLLKLKNKKTRTKYVPEFGKQEEKLPDRTAFTREEIQKIMQKRMENRLTLDALTRKNRGKIKGIAEKEASKLANRGNERISKAEGERALNKMMSRKKTKKLIERENRKVRGKTEKREKEYYKKYKKLKSYKKYVGNYGKYDAYAQYRRPSTYQKATPYAKYLQQRYQKPSGYTRYDKYNQLKAPYAPPYNPTTYTKYSQMQNKRIIVTQGDEQKVKKAKGIRETTRKDKEKIRAYRPVLLDHKGRPLVIGEHYASRKGAVSEGIRSTDALPVHKFKVASVLLDKNQIGLIKKGRKTKVAHKFNKREDTYIEKNKFRNDMERKFRGNSFNMFSYIKTGNIR